MRSTFIAAALVLCTGAACAQSFTPARPVRLVVAFPPGGTTDAIARAFGNKLAEMWKQPVVVENRGGAGGNIATEAVAKADRNGHTLLLNTASIAISAAYYRKLPFDPLKDVAPVTQLTGTSLILVSSPKFPASSMKELIEHAKAQPGKLNYGSNGVGSSPHLATELFKSLAGINVLHVPYKGDALLTTALLSDEVQFALLPTLGVMPQIRAGKLRALAKTGEKRSAALPEVPTIGEAGLPQYDFSGWIGIFTTGGTPRNVVGALRNDFVRALGMPDVRDLLVGGANDIVGSTPEEFEARYKADIALYSRIIRNAKVPLAD